MSNHPIQKCPKGMIFVPGGAVQIELDSNGNIGTKKAPSVCLDETEVVAEVAENTFYARAVQEWRNRGTNQITFDWGCIQDSMRKLSAITGREGDSLKKDIQTRFATDAARCMQVSSLAPPERKYFPQVIPSDPPAVVDNLDDARTVCQDQGKRLPTELEWLRGVSFVRPPRIKPDFSQASRIGYRGPLDSVTNQPANAIGLKGMETNAPEWTDGYAKTGEGTIETLSPYGAFTAFAIYGGIRPEIALPEKQEAYDPLRVFYAPNNRMWSAGLRCATDPISSIAATK